MRNVAMRDNWTEAILGEVATWSTGKNLSASKRNSAGAHPILGANGIIGRTNEVFLDCDLITVGRVGACGETHRSAGPVWVSDNALIAIPNNRVLFDYLYHVLSVFEYQTITSGTTQPLITQNKLKNQVIQLPPLAEQKRIVDVMGAVDTYIAALLQEVADARTARYAVLHELLTAVGDDWTETTLGLHINVVMGQAPPGNDCNKNGVGVPFVKAGEFTDGFPVIREWTTNPLRYAKLGDTLVCVVGATCGKLSQGIDCAIGRSVAALQPLETIDGQFLWNFMTMKVQEMRSGSRGSAQGVITKDDLADLKLVLPPLTEQQQIAETVSTMDDVIGAAQEAVFDAQGLRSGLLSELLSGDHEIPETYDRLLGAA